MEVFTIIDDECFVWGVKFSSSDAPLSLLPGPTGLSAHSAIETFEEVASPKKHELLRHLRKYHDLKA